MKCYSFPGILCNMRLLLLILFFLKRLQSPHQLFRKRLIDKIKLLITRCVFLLLHDTMNVYEYLIVLLRQNITHNGMFHYVSFPEKETDLGVHAKLTTCSSASQKVVSHVLAPSGTKSPPRFVVPGGQYLQTPSASTYLFWAQLIGSHAVDPSNASSPAPMS